MIKYLLFDLDGTITDSADGITNSVSYALGNLGISEEKSNLYRFVGPPLVDSFKEFYGFDEKKAEAEYTKRGKADEDRKQRI